MLAHLKIVERPFFTTDAFIETFPLSGDRPLSHILCRLLFRDKESIERRWKPIDSQIGGEAQWSRIQGPGTHCLQGPETRLDWKKVDRIRYELSQLLSRKCGRRKKWSHTPQLSAGRTDGRPIGCGGGGNSQSEPNAGSGVTPWTSVAQEAPQFWCPDFWLPSLKALLKEHLQASVTHLVLINHRHLCRKPWKVPFVVFLPECLVGKSASKYFMKNVFTLDFQSSIG